MKKLVLFIYCSFPALFYSQVPRYNPRVSAAIETYAFLKGQSAALQKIALQFPELRPHIASAEKNSKVLFGRAQQNIERFLQQELDDLEYVKFRCNIDSLLTEQLKNPIEKERYALDFLTKIRDRPHSITDTLLLKGILSFAYHDAPHQEITDGHSKVFTTQGHPKAAQSIVKFPIPKSWVAEEAEMPQTVKQFTSCGGKGNEKVLLLQYDLPAEYHDAVISQNTISEMLSPETTLIRTDAITIDGRQGIMIEVEEKIHSAATEMKIRMLQFMCIEKQKLYCLQGSIGPVAASQNLEFKIKEYEPLFRLIANNIQIDIDSNTIK